MSNGKQHLRTQFTTDLQRGLQCLCYLAVIQITAQIMLVIAQMKKKLEVSTDLTAEALD
jgi:hypothetical protein